MNITDSCYKNSFKSGVSQSQQFVHDDYQDIVNVFKIRDAKQAQSKIKMNSQLDSDTFDYQYHRRERTHNKKNSSIPVRAAALASALCLSATLTLGNTIGSVFTSGNKESDISTPENSIVEVSDTNLEAEDTHSEYVISHEAEDENNIEQSDEITDDDVNKSIFNFEINLCDEQKYSVEKFIENWQENSWRYQTIEEATGIPAELAAAIHWREASGNFDRCLQDGTKVGSPIQSPVDKGKVFNSFEESAISVFSDPYFSSDNIVKGDYETYLNFAERYNGYGYKNNGLVSPYVYAGTDQYVSGKFVADGSYDASHVDTQPGVAVLLEAIC